MSFEMSTNFKGVTFPKQKVTPIDDALIRRRILPDGILQGCELSYSGSTLTMAAGQLMACGRQFRHPVVQNWPVVDATTGFARLLLTVDLTRTSSADTFDQIVDTIEYASAEDGFPELIQEDINYDGSKYQIAICTLSLGAGGITGVTSQIGVSKPLDTGLSMTLLWENASPNSAFAGQTINLDLSGYDHALIEFCLNPIAWQIKTSAWYRVDAGESIVSVADGNPYTYLRGVTVNTNNVTFGTGRLGNTENNNNLVPLRIYGLKGVTK